METSKEKARTGADRDGLQRCVVPDSENDTPTDPLMGWFQLGKASQAYRDKRRKPGLKGRKPVREVRQ